MGPLDGESPGPFRVVGPTHDDQEVGAIPFDVNHLWPLITHSSPSRRAVVWMEQGRSRRCRARSSRTRGAAVAPRPSPSPSPGDPRPG